LDSGHARVYKWNSSTNLWVQLGQDIDGEATTDYSGNCVSINAVGDVIAISAPDNDGTINDNRGHTRIYEWNNSTNSWVQLGQDINGESTGDNSGRGNNSISLNSTGDRVAIGAYLNGGNGAQSGHVRIYRWTDSSWVQLGQDINGESAYNEFGCSVSLNADGNIVAIGERGYTVPGDTSSKGRVRIFSWNGSSWNQVGSGIVGEGMGDLSGEFVSINSSGDKVAIGSRFNDGNGVDSGHVRVYNLT
jgi:hypothetical protein